MNIKALMAMMALIGMTAQAREAAEAVTADPPPRKVRMLVRDGHPIVDGVYVNGNGPYRFLVDTGTNVNLIGSSLAQSIGLTASFRTEFASPTGLTIARGSDGIEVQLDRVKADNQKFLFSGMDAIHNRWTDIQGVLGQWFLSGFDYTLDLRGKQLVFGKQDQIGTRTPFTMPNGRMAISTSLGVLILDSGADRLVLFGVQPDSGPGLKVELRTLAGSQQTGMVFGKQLTIEGQKIWHGDAVTIPNLTEHGVAGLLPLGLFRVLYVCNSKSYVVFE